MPAALGDKVPCPKCSHEPYTLGKFCNNCGTKSLSVPEAAPAQAAPAIGDKIPCPKCNHTPYTLGKFCNNCGTKTLPGSLPTPTKNAPKKAPPPAPAKSATGRPVPSTTVAAAAKLKAEEEERKRQAKLKAEEEERMRQAKLKAEEEERMRQAKLKAEEEERQKQAAQAKTPVAPVPAPNITSIPEDEELPPPPDDQAPPPPSPDFEDVEDADKLVRLLAESKVTVDTLYQVRNSLELLSEVQSTSETGTHSSDVAAWKTHFVELDGLNILASLLVKKRESGNDNIRHAAIECIEAFADDKEYLAPILASSNLLSGLVDCCKKDNSTLVRSKALEALPLICWLSQQGRKSVTAAVGLATNASAGTGKEHTGGGREENFSGRLSFGDCARGQQGSERRIGN